MKAGQRSTGRSEPFPTCCRPNSKLARPFRMAIWQDASKAFNPECLIPEIYSTGVISCVDRDSRTKTSFTGLSVRLKTGHHLNGRC